jgi:AcrR family transcriptional regulator
MALRARRTQEERSADTRARLLDATIASLSELGYAHTTTTEIADRAGVSRGAQLHHFPTKAELFTTAVEHLFELRHAEFRAAFASLPATAERGPRAIELLWWMMEGPTFHAWLELVVAARTDPELRTQMQALAQRFAENVQRTFRELFAASEASVLAAVPAGGGPGFELAPIATFALLEGLALMKIVNQGEPRIDAVIAMLKQLAAGVVPPVAPNPRGPR